MSTRLIYLLAPIEFWLHIYSLLFRLQVCLRQVCLFQILEGHSYSDIFEQIFQADQFKQQRNSSAHVTLTAKMYLADQKTDEGIFTSAPLITRYIITLRILQYRNSSTFVVLRARCILQNLELTKRRGHLNFN